MPTTTPKHPLTRSPIARLPLARFLVPTAIAACGLLLTGCATSQTNARASHEPACVAWQSTDSAAPRSVALSLGAGDRIGTQLEDARLARSLGTEGGATHAAAVDTTE